MTQEPDDTRAESVRVADAIRAEVASGSLRPGDRVPSVRNLAVKYGVAEMTAQKAVTTLRNEGLIVTKVGKGSFVRDVAAAPDTPAESPQYVALTRHLDALDSTVREMADRLQELETAFRSGQSSSQRQAK
jgi:GntR family transcriptional regulator